MTCSDLCVNLSIRLRNWALWTKTLCRRLVTCPPHPAWFLPPPTFPAPRRSQVGGRPSIDENHLHHQRRFNALCDFITANAGGSGRDALQSARQPEESATAGATAASALPGPYKQRTPMYNAGNTTNPATPTSPSTPTSTPANNAPPAAATASQQDAPSEPPTTPQTPTPAPTPTPPQPQPKKNLSLTVRETVIS